MGVATVSRAAAPHRYRSGILDCCLPPASAHGWLRDARLAGHLRQRPGDLDLALDVTFTDIDSNYRLTLRNGVLIYVERPAEEAAGATLTLTKARMIGLLGGDTSSPASTSSET